MREEQKQNERTDQLIRLYLNKSYNDDELKELLAWVNKDPENRKYFQDYCTLWSNAYERSSSADFDPVNAFAKFRSALLHHNIPDSKSDHKYSKRKILLSLSIAASVIILLTIPYLFALKTDIRTITATNQIVRDTLPDGSIVTLNQNSSLKYSRYLIGKSREAVMTGEVFYKIAKEHGVPFRVKFGGYGVEVVGTSFNIKTGREVSVVSVFEGIVKVLRENGLLHKNTSELMLRKNEKVILNQDKSSKPLKVQKANINTIAWERGAFIFEGTSLEEVARDLSEYYHINITVKNDSLKHLKLNAKLETNDLNMILKVLSLTFDLKIDQEGNSYLLYSE